MPYVTFEIVQAAILGLQVKKQSVSAKIAKLRDMQRKGASTAGAKDSALTRHLTAQRKVSAAARKRMAEAQRKRWDAVRRKAGVSYAVKPEVMKPRLSPAGRRRIIAATKKRWAAIRAAKEKSRA
jgi:hypothetical protein